MKRTSTTLLALSSLFALACPANESGSPDAGGTTGDRGALFALEQIPSLRFSLSRDALAALEEKPRKFVTGSMQHGGRTYDIAIKLKGNRSFRPIGGKPAFTVRFDKVDKGGRFLGMRKLTLNNMVEDPGRMREILGYRMFRAAGVPAPRVAYARVEINDDLFGIYLMVEPYDAPFFARVLGDDAGPLLEGEYGCDLNQGDTRRFDVKLGKKKRSRAELQKLIDFATTSPDQLFASGSPLDTEEVLSYLATSTLLGDFDGYWQSHNYMFYRSPKSGKWLMLPWGGDRLFWRQLHILGSRGRLARICFSDENCTLRYTRRLRELVDVFEELKLDREMRTLAALLGEDLNSSWREDLRPSARQKNRRYMRDFVRERPAVTRSALGCLDDTGTPVDRDGDGFFCRDCDNANDAVHPGARELCDGLDNDCSGFVDDHGSCRYCETVTVSGVSFSLCPDELPWKIARAFCAERGMTLARFDDTEQSQAVYRRTRELRPGERWWLGATDVDSEGEFQWIDGSPLQFTFWGEDQPNDTRCGQDCMALDDDDDGRWADSHCRRAYPFVCRAPSDKVTPPWLLNQ